MKINRYESAEENVFLLIEEANPGLDLNSENVTLGTPTPFDGSATDDDTVITVTAIPNQGFSGHRDVTYNRLTLEEAIGSTVYPDIFVLSPGSDEEQIRLSLCNAMGLVPDGGLLFTDENDGPVAVPADGHLKLALIDVLSDSLLYNERPKRMAVALGDFMGVQLLINPEGTTVTTLDLFTAFGSPTEAGVFIYINRGTIGGPLAGTATYCIRSSGTFPTGSKLFLINEGHIPAPAATSAGGQAGQVRGCINTAGLAGSRLELQNATGLIEASGGMGGWVVISDDTSSIVFSGGSGTGFHRTSATTPPNGSVPGVAVEVVRAMTQGTYDTPGIGGIYNVTITNNESLQSTSGQIITGNGGTAGRQGTLATYTGFDDLATVAPSITIGIGALPAVVACFLDAAGALAIMSGADEDHIRDMIV